MPKYDEMYYTLFNKITDVINELKQVQMQTEELYVKGDDKQAAVLKLVSDNNPKE